jgi:hypothetical protein
MFSPDRVGNLKVGNLKVEKCRLELRFGLFGEKEKTV